MSLFTSMIPFLLIMAMYALPVQSNTGSQEETLASIVAQAEKMEQAGKHSQAAAAYNKVAFAYWQGNQTEEAITYFQRSLRLNNETGNTNAMQSIHNNLGLLHSEIKSYTEALDHFEKSLQINKQMGRKEQVVSILINIGLTQQSLNQYEKSNLHLETALEIAQESNNIRLLRTCYSMLAENHQNLGNTEKSYKYFNQYNALEQHIKKTEIKEIQQAKKEIEQERNQTKEALSANQDSLRRVQQITKEREMEISLLQKEKQVKDLEMKQQQAALQQARQMITFGATGLILLILLIFFIFRGYQNKKKAHNLLMKQKQVIDKKNENITNSLNYAKRIQKAMLPAQRKLTNYFPESFIYFSPRDKVSGDFFFFSSLDHSQTLFQTRLQGQEQVNFEKMLISAIDCTGHGVPGAFMSMIGYNLISEIIGMGIEYPEEILENLHTGVKNSLKQDTTENRDGMDMSMCLVDKKEKKIYFAGAKNPLVYFQQGEMHQIKGDVHPIGGIERKPGKRTFTRHTIDISSPTTVYLFSDGFQDQLGGEKGMKFMSKRFKELLSKIHQKPMTEQKEILQQEMKNWIGEKHHQIDDILVIGFTV